MTENNLKKFFYSVLLGLCAILLIGGRGILNIRKITNENKRIVKNINSLEISNQKIIEEINALTTNEKYQEKIVRELLDFSKEDEIVYEFE